MTCGTFAIAYADVFDAEALVEAFAWTGGFPFPAAEQDDILSDCRETLWKAYRAWDPTRAVRFRAYAWTMLRNRAIDRLRRQRGRVIDGVHRPRGLDVESLDALLDGDGGDDLVGSRIGSWAGDPADDRSPDLARALAR